MSLKRRQKSVARPLICVSPTRTKSVPHVTRFQSTPLPLEDRVSGAVTPAVVLLVETALAFLLALWAINRADLVGGGA